MYCCDTPKDSVTSMSIVTALFHDSHRFPITHNSICTVITSWNASSCVTFQTVTKSSTLRVHLTGNAPCHLKSDANQSLKRFVTLKLVTPWHSVRAMLANSGACCGLDIGIPDDTMYASPIVSTWTRHIESLHETDKLHFLR